MRFGRVVLLISISVIGWDCASAQPSDDTIIKTVQCEAGRIGERLRSAGGFPENLRVTVSWTGTKTRDAAAGFGFKLFGWGAQGDLSRQQINKLKTEGLPFNLHPDNLAVCRGYQIDIIKEGIGVYDCLVNQKLASLRVAAQEGSGSIGCESQATLTKKLSGNAKLNIWGADLGPSASWGDTYVFSFVIAAPPPPKR
jgi:hypothetical protein